jgi:hypothetical protein
MRSEMPTYEANEKRLGILVLVLEADIGVAAVRIALVLRGVFAAIRAVVAELRFWPTPGGPGRSGEIVRESANTLPI